MKARNAYDPGPGIYTHALSCLHRLVNSVVYQLEGLA